MSNHVIGKILQNYFRRHCRRMLPGPSRRCHPTYPYVRVISIADRCCAHRANIFEHDVVVCSIEIVRDAILLEAVFNHGRWNHIPRLHDPLYKNLLRRRSTQQSNQQENNSSADSLPLCSYLPYPLYFHVSWSINTSTGCNSLALTTFNNQQ